MKKILLLLIMSLILISYQKSSAVDCPDGYMPETIEIRDPNNNNALVCWMFVCYICEPQEVGDIIFNGLLPCNPFYDYNDMYAKCMNWLLTKSGEFLNDYCDIPPCNGNYHNYTVTTPKCVKKIWENPTTTKLVPCDWETGWCVKLMGVCYDGVTYNHTVLDDRSYGSQPCSTRAEQYCDYPNESPCWSPPAAWCYQ